MSAELEAVRADADADREGVVVPLITDSGTTELHVPPAGRWKTRANRALNTGDFDTWAELTLAPEDWEAWQAADPVNDDMEAFFEAFKATTGDDPKKSPASTRSSRSTARR